ncbi:MAG: glycosyltransferase [Sedimenticola sp.]
MAFFPRVIRRIEGVPVFYAPFSKIPLVSELISLLAPVGIIFRLRRKSHQAVLFYNRQTAYLLTLLAASVLRYHNVLDLEDGEFALDVETRPRVLRGLVARLYDRLCSGGALLACSALADLTTARPVLCYYGTSVGEPSSIRWQDKCVRVLMGGTLSIDTGAELLIEAIRHLRREAPPWAEQLRVEVTGMGPSLEGLRALAVETGAPKITIRGRTTDLQYREVLSRCDVGLALKPNTGPLADTTFPSKVIEFASAGLLVLTTDISDVRDVLGSGALYLTHDEPQALIALLERVVKDRFTARECAQRGLRKVQELCSPRLAGRMVANFVFGDKW